MTLFARTIAVCLAVSALGINLRSAHGAENLPALVPSEWVTSDHARIRLVPGTAKRDGKRVIGIQIELEKGWHTYWRNPGNSGVPPRLNWTGSDNLGGTAIKWPAPSWITDDYGTSYGYLDEVIFPVTVSPARAGDDMSLKLAIDFAVCAEICIPEFGQMSLELPHNGIAPEDLKNLVAAYETRIPRYQSAQSTPRIKSSKLEIEAGKPVLTITAELGEGAARAELFVEGPPEFYFSVAGDAEISENGEGRFKVRIAGLKSLEALSGARLGGTLVTSEGASEYWWTVQ